MTLSRPTTLIGAAAALGTLFLVARANEAAEPGPTSVTAQFATTAKPVIQKFCLGCHSTKLKKGSLDLERFASAVDVRKDLKAWQQVIELLEAGEMPPKDKPQPAAAEKAALIAWARSFLDEETRARAGDPGYVPLRRLSNFEYDTTIAALTGVDLRPTREFPADGAAGEGFTNAAEALSDISPTLLAKYFNAAKEISEHAVLLPDGFRFSPGKTRRDWTNESLATLRRKYAEFAPEGRLRLEAYLRATIHHRDALRDGTVTIDAAAAMEKLNAKYLGELWRALAHSERSYPLDSIAARWQKAQEADVPALAAEIAAWQAAAWQVVPIGSYRYGNSVRGVPNDPAAAEAQPIKLAVKPAPGQPNISVHLAARDILPCKPSDRVVWRRPRFERPGQSPLLLRDLREFGPNYETDYPAIFKDTARYLTAAAEPGSLSPDALAAKYTLDVELLKRWIRLLGLERRSAAADPAALGQAVPAVPLDLLDDPAPNNDSFPAIRGWKKKGIDLPIFLANASDKVEQIPGRVTAHGIAVHPTPSEFVGVAWKSPAAGNFLVALHVAHAHPACGNGVAWWLEHRRADRAAVVAGGSIDLGGEAKPAPQKWKIEKGDTFVLAVDAKNGDHVCDMTDIALTITEIDASNRVWDMERDVADCVLAGNPHPDRLGNAAVWSFVRGPSRPTGTGAAFTVPQDSILGRWREAVAEPGRQAEAAKLAEQVQILLSGPRPAQDKNPDRMVYDNLVTADSTLVRGLDTTRFRTSGIKKSDYGLANLHFKADGSLEAAANSVIRLRLPAGLFVDHQFIADGAIEGSAADRVVQFQATPTAPSPDSRWDGKTAVVAVKDGAGYKRLLLGLADFRRVFPLFVCFPPVIPTDEAVSLKMFHREDEPLIRLFLNEEQTRQLDHLWTLHRFISRQPVAENNYLPQFIGFVTQDQPKELLDYFEGQRPAFRKRAEDFQREEAAAIPRQLDALMELAARAYRRPLEPTERTELLALYHVLRETKGLSHDEAFRSVLSRILAAPAFLFRIERAPSGSAAAPVNDWELATRLSYFLWSAPPDDELRRLAAAGRLHDPTVLAEQARRLLSSDRVRALAIEFGAQWIHVRGFDEFNEKSDRLFPQFDAALRRDIYEESIRFFQDLFQADRPVTDILDSDATFLNENLAKHYGIPGVQGPEWRRVEGVKNFGRGGILGLASVQARQAGAARTSPVLRGNWVVETLLGEKLPRPPPNVPKLPEEEGGAGLTMRQLVEKHASVAECAVCHRRIDPFGFAFEHYDSIGRRRDTEIGGMPINAHATLKDGAEFDGIDGLRTYLLTKKKDVIVRLFCRRMLGYALGRSVTLSDQPLIDEMVIELNRHDGRLSAAVLAIVRSSQFRMVRGRDFAE